MNGPIVTCKHTVGIMHTVTYYFHCRKDCRWFQSESGFNECDWRDADAPAMCGHWMAQVEALKWLADYTRRHAEELEADL